MYGGGAEDIPLPAHIPTHTDMRSITSRDALAFALVYLGMGIFTAIVVVGLRAHMGEYHDDSWGMVAKVAVAHVVGWPYVWLNT